MIELTIRFADHAAIAKQIYLIRRDVMEVWMMTYLGEKFNPLEPDEDKIHLADIAHGLSNTCRYSGQCKFFYSVAQHSVLLARSLPEHMKPTALLHDAAEAYLTDIPSLIKPVLCGYKAIENSLLYTIFNKFGMTYDYTQRYVSDKLFHSIEYPLLAAEVSALVQSSEGWYLPNEPLDIVIEYWNPQKAENEFLEECARCNLGGLFSKPKSEGV